MSKIENKSVPPGNKGKVKAKPPTPPAGTERVKETNGLILIVNPSNFLLWKESMQRILYTAPFDVQGRILEFSAHPDFGEDVPDPPETTDAEYAIAGGQAGDYDRKKFKLDESIYNESVKQAMQQRSRYTATFAATYQVILNHLSQQCINVLQSSEEYEAINKKKDPLRLFSLIKDKVAGGLSKTVKGTTHEDALMRYATIRQQRGESISEFSKRFKMELQYLKDRSLEAIAGDQEMQAGTFLKRLDTGVFGDFEERLVADALREGGTPYPKTLLEAERCAYNLEFSRARVKAPIAASVFATEAKPKKKKPKSQKPDSPPPAPPPPPPSRDTEQAGGPSTKKREFPCPICKELGHPAHRCPLIEVASKAALSSKGAGGGRSAGAGKASSRVYATECAFCDEPQEDCLCPRKRAASAFALKVRIFADASPSKVTPWHVLLDGQAGEGIFNNPSLLTDIRAAPIHCEFTGIGGSLVADRVGEFGAFGTVFFHPDASANIISWHCAETRSGGIVKYDTSVSTDLTIVIGGETHVFSRLGEGLHAKVFGKASALVAASSEPILLTDRELAAATKAREFMNVVGAPSVADIYGLLQTGAPLAFTAKDLQNAEHVFGTHLPTVKGKATEPPPIAVESGRIHRMLSARLTMYADIMFVYGHAYLLTIVKPTGLLQVSHLGAGKGAKSQASLRSALHSHCAECWGQNFIVEAIHFDGEGAFKASRSFVLSELRADVVDLAGVHVGAIEAQIKTVKCWARGIAHSLPYNLAQPLYVYLVFFCINRLNRLPSKRGYPNIPAFEAHTGRKVSVSRDFRIGFGRYAQTVSPNLKGKNSVELSRTEGAIALHSARGAGAVVFLRLKTLRTIIRTKWTELPFPQDVLVLMNQYAEMGGDGGVPPIDEDDEVEPLRDDGDALDGDVLDMVEPGIPIDKSIVSEESDTPADEIVDEVEQTGVGESALPVDEVPEDLQMDLNLGAPRPRSRVDYSALAGINRRKVRSYKLTVRRALREMKEPALAALFKEIKGFIDIEAFEPKDWRTLSLKQKKSIIRSSIFLKSKFLADGSFDKLKARLVAGGDMQERIPFEDHSSPTAALASLFMLAAIAAKERRHVVTLDIGMAYLNAEMPENVEVLMTLDPVATGFYLQMQPEQVHLRRQDGTMIVKLKKALYGCIQSARLWYDTLRVELETLGMVANPLDPCVFNKGKGVDQVTVIVYVDDLMVTSKDKGKVESIVSALEGKFKTITVTRGFEHSYLGMQFDFSVTGRVKISMPGYINDVIEYSEVTGLSRTPAGENLFDVDPISPLLDVDNANRFHTLVAKLMYLAKRVRPDLLCSVMYLATRVKAPTAQDLKKLNRVVKYLNSTRELGIVLIASSEISVTAFIDASYGVHMDAKSHSGIYITLGSGPIFAKSSKQKIVSKSSHEAELVAASDGGSQVIWTRSFLISQGYDVGAATIMQDNMATISSLNKGSTGSERSRHINIRYYWIKDRISSGELDISYVSTNSMVADILTKPLQGDKFEEMRDFLLNWSA